MPATLQAIAVKRLKGSIQTIAMLFSNNDAQRILANTPAYIVAIDKQWKQLNPREGSTKTNLPIVTSYKLWEEFKYTWKNGHGDIRKSARCLFECNEEIRSAKV